MILIKIKKPAIHVFEISSDYSFANEREISNACMAGVLVFRD